MSTFKYWKEPNYVRTYEIGKMEDLYQSLIKHGINDDAISEIMRNGEKITKKTSKKAVAEWYFSAMNTMDELLDENTRKDIRGDCACCLEGKRKALCASVKKEFKTAAERIEVINKTHYVFGHEIKINDEGKYEVTFFDEKQPEKVCSCLKVVMDTEMSPTYCWCCGKHIQHHLENLLGEELKVELVTSALMSKGKKSCQFILESK
ncbi:MAG: hypothetical protein LBM77_13505 [Spirochaetaceae bacterium]|jgi:hypothetical protein|nr:hypothetical protein [Spirochaetaceae bacterium]